MCSKKAKEDIDRYKFERELTNQGYKAICGIDEAGRGPLAGPVCAAAVILDKNKKIEGLNDSKKLSAKKREELFELIKIMAIGYSVVLIDNKVIDEINILQATFKAMREAVKNLDVKPDFILVDGTASPYNKKSPQILPIKKGDSISASIAAASIVAKVTRDSYMIEMSKKYENYSFEKHKGYGTKLHFERISEFGISDIHRKSFLKKYYDKQKS